MNGTKFQRLICVLLLTVVCGNTADEQIETSIIDTKLGPIKGLKVKNNITGKDVFEFRGIRFAKPPVGNLRFEKPQPTREWEGTLDATKFGPACPQSIVFPDFTPSEMSEDCLFLNVYVPHNLDTHRKLSVMVWIHGGGLNIGFSHQYDGGWISTEGDVILVTINYRLDILGFFSMYSPVAKGNYGIWDQKVALQWVHDNIASFGGNPNSVTIFGESAGGWSASLQSLIPSNQGLFQRVISQSGVVTRTLFASKAKTEETLKDLAKKTSCSLDDSLLFIQCLRETSTEDLLKATDMFSDMPDDRLLISGKYLPVIDGELYTAHPISRLDDPTSKESVFFRSLDFMSGTTSNEGSLIMMINPAAQEKFGFNITDGITTKFVCEGIVSPLVEEFLNNEPVVKKKMCDFYTVDTGLGEQAMRAANLVADIVFGFPTAQMLEYHSSSKGKTFQYLFSKISDTDLSLGGPSPDWMKGNPHGGDLLFMFDVGQLLPSMAGTKLSDRDGQFSKNVIRYWTSFAKHGQPEGDVPWKPFDVTSKNYLDFDNQIKQGVDLNKEMVEFWSKQIPQINVDYKDISGRDEL